MPDQRSDILRGTLDLMVLKTLDQMGPLHGYGLALRIEQLSESALRVNQGTIYLCLVRLVQKGWITATWAPPTAIAGLSSTRSRRPAVSSSKSKRRTGNALPA